MIKRVAVAGCRHYENYDEAKEYIDFCIGEISDYIICFWDGKSKGTKSLLSFAEKYGKPVKIKIIKPFV